MLEEESGAATTAFLDAFDAMRRRAADPPQLFDGTHTAVDGLGLEAATRWPATTDALNAQRIEALGLHRGAEPSAPLTHLASLFDAHGLAREQRLALLRRGSAPRARRAPSSGPAPGPCASCCFSAAILARTSAWECCAVSRLWLLDVQKPPERP